MEKSVEAGEVEEVDWFGMSAVDTYTEIHRDILKYIYFGFSATASTCAHMCTCVAAPIIQVSVTKFNFALARVLC